MKEIEEVKRTDDIVKEFLMYFPDYAGRIVKVKYINYARVQITMDNGEICEYSTMEHTYRRMDMYDGSENAWKREFAYRLCRLMAERGFTQASLAEACGMSQESISKYIRLSCIPSAYAVDRIAKALGCSYDDLTKFID